jgi:putative hydrolase of the HAD superfamily
MSDMPWVIGFDADDTLWHNEVIFERMHERYRALLARYHSASTVDATLLATEMRNIELYGYGVKGFTLSAIETAIQLTAGKISAEEIRNVIELGREMLVHPGRGQRNLGGASPPLCLVRHHQGRFARPGTKTRPVGVGSVFSADRNRF